MMQIIYRIIHRCLYPFVKQKFNNKMNEKRSQEYQSMGPEYVVTGQKNSQVLEFLLR